VFGSSRIDVSEIDRILQSGCWMTAGMKERRCHEESSLPASPATRASAQAATLESPESSGARDQQAAAGGVGTAIPQVATSHISDLLRIFTPGPGQQPESCPLRRRRCCSVRRQERPRRRHLECAVGAGRPHGIQPGGIFGAETGAVEKHVVSENTIRCL
jgi:hypothetical protein